MYNNEFRAEAMTMAKEVGVQKTARKLNVAETSIYNWLKASLPAKTRNKYTDGYKRAAVKLASKIGINAATKELGVYNGAIYRWRGGVKSPRLTESTPRDELRSLKEENEKLKKVAATFKDALWLFVKEYDVSNVSIPVTKMDNSATGMVHVCEHCGNKYIARVPYQKYCSEQCRVKHYYLRTKESSFEGVIKRLTTR